MEVQSGMFNHKIETWLRIGEYIREGSSEDRMALLGCGTHSLTSLPHTYLTWTIPGARVFLTPASDHAGRGSL